MNPKAKYVRFGQQFQVVYLNGFARLLFFIFSLGVLGQSAAGPEAVDGETALNTAVAVPHAPGFHNPLEIARKEYR